MCFCFELLDSQEELWCLPLEEFILKLEYFILKGPHSSSILLLGWKLGRPMQIWPTSIPCLLYTRQMTIRLISKHNNLGERSFNIASRTSPSVIPHVLGSKTQGTGHFQNKHSPNPKLKINWKWSHLYNLIPFEPWCPLLNIWL